MSEEIRQMLGQINKKLEGLLALKRDVAELNMRTKNIEDILSEYIFVLNEEEIANLEEAMKEYITGKTISLEDAERILGYERRIWNKSPKSSIKTGERRQGTSF
jgi:hypothetical protein